MDIFFQIGKYLRRNVQFFKICLLYAAIYFVIILGFGFWYCIKSDEFYHSTIQQERIELKIKKQLRDLIQYNLDSLNEETKKDPELKSAYRAFVTNVDFVFSDARISDIERHRTLRFQKGGEKNTKDWEVDSSALKELKIEFDLQLEFYPAGITTFATFSPLMRVSLQSIREDSYKTQILLNSDNEKVCCAMYFKASEIKIYDDQQTNLKALDKPREKLISYMPILDKIWEQRIRDQHYKDVSKDTEFVRETLKLQLNLETRRDLLHIPAGTIDGENSYEQLVSDIFDITNQQPSSFFTMLYFSTVTVTTLGYGDILPLTRYTRALVAIESILGLLIMGFFLNSVASQRKREKYEAQTIELTYKYTVEKRNEP